MIDLRHLRHALALAEHRNFARAAEALHLTQPALSRSIQALESHFGETLFDRSRRDVTPTAMGELLLRHARQLNLAAAELERDLQLARGMELGELRIGAGPFAGAALVGAPVGQLCQLHPQLHVEVIIAPWLELPERLQRREIDLLVADLHEIETLEDYERLPFGEHLTLPVCRAGHPLNRQTELSLPALLDYPLAGPNLPAAVSRQFLDMLPRALHQTLRQQLKLSITCDSSPTLKSILLHSDAVAVLPLFMAEEELRDGRLIALPRLNPGLHGRFGVAWLKGRRLSRPAQRYIELLQAHDALLASREAELLRL